MKSFKKIHGPCLIIFLIFQFSFPVSADIFKCKSANGNTIYSSQKCAETAEVFSLKNAKQTERLAEIYKNKPSVDIYITSWCPYCKKAIAYLKSKRIDFNIYNIENDAQAKAKKQRLAPGYTGVPLTVINDKILKGFNPSYFDAALNLNHE